MVLQVSFLLIIIKSNVSTDAKVALARSDTSTLTTHLLAEVASQRGYTVVLTCVHDLKVGQSPGFTGVLRTLLRQE